MRRTLVFDRHNKIYTGKLAIAQEACNIYRLCRMKYNINPNQRTGHQFIKILLYSTQLSMKFLLLINVKMPAIVGILRFRSRKTSNIGLSWPDKMLNFLISSHL